MVDARLGFSWAWDDIDGISVLVDHVEGLLDLSTDWAFKLVYGAMSAAVKAA